MGQYQVEVHLRSNFLMKLHYLQHEPFEDPGSILAWAKERKLSLSATMVFKNEPLPHPDSFDILVMMGGYMSVYEEERHPWLVAEKALILQAIRSGKAVLGVCLGAQLIASALGAEVRRHMVKEIGWFPVTLTPLGRTSRLFAGWPETFQALHWHGDIFNIPAGATKLASSRACPNQAFSYGERTAALQFHAESTADSVQRLVSGCAGDLIPDEPFVQSAETILAQREALKVLPKLLYSMLDSLASSPLSESK